jgi:epoxide hydrolase
MSRIARAVNHVARDGDADTTPSRRASRAYPPGTHLDGSGVLPFRIEVPQAAVDDLSAPGWTHHRIAETFTELMRMRGYDHIQATRPKTLAYGLTDSPIGQFAWIVEKFKEWVDPAAALPQDAIGRDHIRTNISPTA